MKHYKATALKYAEDVASGKILAGKEVVLACQRFLDDLKREDLELHTKEPDFVCGIIEKLMVHKQGESIDGEPLTNKPFILLPWQIFIIYNLIGFYFKGKKERRYKEAFIFLPRKSGKAISLDTEIPTPDGWKLMRDVHEGDYVFGQDGRPSRVIVESEIFHKPMFLVRFDDGTEIKASADHLWTVQTKDSRRASRYTLKQKGHHELRPDLRENGGWFTTDTQSMASDFVKIRSDGKGVEYKYRVPIAKPVQYEEKRLPLDPYTFGVWVGDGASIGTHITCSDTDHEEMMALLSECGHRVAWHAHKGRAGSIALDTVTRGTPHPVRNALRELGVWGNKHIPDIYMQSSVEQRLALLQGLMDTDGHCTKNGECEFSQKSEVVSRQVHELLSSLGIRATIKCKHAVCNGKDAGIVYNVRFFTDSTMPCFRLKRKRERLRVALASRSKAKSIIGITPIAEGPSKCIMVDNPSHLYLAGRGYVATHNTMLVAALAFALALLERKSGSKIYIVAASQKQAIQSFEDITYTLRYRGMIDDFRVRDNNAEHSLHYEFLDDESRPDGSIDIEALASNPDAQDSFNCNIAIADEIHAFKKAAQYNRFKEAMKAYTNKLMIGITTAGDDVNSFCYRRLQYGVKVVNGTVEDDSLFCFISRADQDEKGNCDYLSPIQHQKANPSYGVTIRPEDMMSEAVQAANDPQQRKDFLSRSLNIYTSALKAWFDIEEFRRSDTSYSWTLDELSRLPIEWYGGADLSRMYDLTAAALYGTYKGVDICITHAFFPIVMAARKAEEDGIPLFGWADDGLLTMCNMPTVNISDIVNWFISMRRMGFKIKRVGHDRKFAGEEYFPAMKKAGFAIADQPQLFWVKSQGFRHIEKAVKDGKFYYLHSEAYEYCVSNVRAVEKTDDAVQYEKIQPNDRIDLFDASVFACIQMIEANNKSRKGKAWWGEGGNNEE